MELFTRAHLLSTLEQLGVHPTDDIFSKLAAAYSETGRHYHTARHVSACLAQVRHYEALASQPREIQIALWFHDAIYDTQRKDNELRSADWAAQFLGIERVDRARVERVHALIMATRHAVPVDDPDQQLLVDIDLGILGQKRAIFDEYDAAIRREYHWVPWPRYVEGRIAVLTGFLDRPHIYSTAPLRERLETQARSNIAHAIDTLKHDS